MKLPLRPLGIAALVFSTLYGCAPDESGTPSSSGGGRASGGATPTGGTPGSGGATNAATGGATVYGTGGGPVAESGGSLGTATGGSGAGSGGASATGGNAAGTGGALATGGAGGGPARTGGAGGNTAGGGSNGSGGAGGRDVRAVPLDPALLSRCTGTNPIKCAIPVPANGNYTVTVELGSATAASTSRVQAELYRISVPPVSLAAGTFSQHTFSLNVRPEAHDGYMAIGKELNLLIDGAAPALHGLGYVAAPNIPTIFVAGDSTVCDWDPAYTSVTPKTAGPDERGWAQELSQFLEPTIAVANYADSGETAQGFYGKFWGPAKAALRQGDWVFVQFGHNDMGDYTPAQFKTAMMRYVTDARTVGATPVLITPPGRKGATLADPGFAQLDQATRDLALSANVALIDLTKLSLNYYATVNKSTEVFATTTEGTHFGEKGATALSKLVTTDIKNGTLSLKNHVR